MKDKKDAKRLAWELFKETGDIKYYSLYSRLKDKE